MRQDVAVVCDGEGVAVDSQLETQSETHDRVSFLFFFFAREQKTKKTEER